MTNAAPRVGGIVLCGGSSRRMGQSKAWLLCGREHLLQRVVRIVGEAVQPVVVAARPGQTLPTLASDVQIVTDATAHVGPLAGIAAGLDALAGRRDAAFVAACDQPLLKPAFITRLIELLEDRDAVVVEHEGHVHPTTAVYRLNVRGILAEMLAARRWRATTFAERCTPRLVQATDFSGCDPGLESLRNFNDWPSYAALLEKLEQT